MSIECPACGAEVESEDQLIMCPWCEELKCPACDMGRAVGCIRCDGEAD